MEITLYQYPGGDGVGSVSPPCLRVDLALRLLGVEFRLRNLRSPQAVAEVSATGRLPVLEIDGERFVESTRILDELERRFDAPWAVTDARAATHLRLWEYALNDYYYWCGYYFRWFDDEGRGRFLDAMLRGAGPLRAFLVRRLFSARQKKRAAIHGVGGRRADDVLRELGRGLDMVLSDLGPGGPFLLERDRPSRADLSAAALFSQAGLFDAMPEILALVEERPAIRSYLRRVWDACGGDRPLWLQRGANRVGM